MNDLYHKGFGDKIWFCPAFQPTWISYTLSSVFAFIEFLFWSTSSQEMALNKWQVSIPTRYTVSSMCWMTTRKTFVIQRKLTRDIKAFPGKMKFWPHLVLFPWKNKGQPPCCSKMEKKKKKRNNRSVTALKQQELVDVSLSQWNGFQESKMYL